MAALVLRIKFPMTYPLIYKTLRVDANFTAKQAVQFIAETVNVANLLNGNEGLYLPDEKRWLDDNTPLSSYESLQDVVRISVFVAHGIGHHHLELVSPVPCYSLPISSFLMVSNFNHMLRILPVIHSCPPARVARPAQFSLHIFAFFLFVLLVSVYWYLILSFPFKPIFFQL